MEIERYSHPANSLIYKIRNAMSGYFRVFFIVSFSSFFLFFVPLFFLGGRGGEVEVKFSTLFIHALIGVFSFVCGLGAFQ